MPRRRSLREPPIFDAEDFAEYEDTPWLTALANFCAAAGVFIGVYALIFLAGYAHKGFRAYWPLLLILVLDVAVNVAVRTVRWRRRRALRPARPSRSPRASAGRSAR